MDLNKTVNVKNRSNSTAGYTLPDSGVRRTWVPGEVKKSLTVAELEQATYIPGGLAILQDYLLINDQEVCEYLGLSTEPEYFYSEENIKTLLGSGTLDQLLDCLDFAPEGVLDLIKKMSVELKLNDISKREAIKEKLKFDITAAISNVEYANTPDENEGTAKTRRAKPVGEAKTNTAEKGGRRTAPAIPTYVKVK